MDNILYEVGVAAQRYKDSLKATDSALTTRDTIIRIAALDYGIKKTDIAKAADISRERLYQIIGQTND